MKLSNASILYILSIIGSGCGFVTQMLVAGYWTTAFSNDVFHFSVNVAFYFLCLGLGSLVSTKWKSPSLYTLLGITLVSALWTACSITLLRYGISRVGNVVHLPLFVVGVSGLLAGNIIPLTLKVGRNEASLKLSRLFFLDYSAAIVFTFLFTFVLLIPLGYGKTALALGGACTLATLVVVALGRLWRPSLFILALVSLVVPYPLHETIKHAAAPTMNSQGKAKILVDKQSHYQKIVLTQEETPFTQMTGLKQHVLYLDGFVQFSSLDEQTYHICIVNIPVAAMEYSGKRAENVLVLGGGDGLAVRNLLKVNTVKKVTLVELDPDMIDLAMNEPMVRLYNLDSLRDKRVNVITTDAFRWVRQNQEKFDLIVIDFPAPKNIALSRLFSAEFYSAALSHLSEGGFVSIQAGPSFSFEDKNYMTLSKVTSSIQKTVQSVGYRASVYSSFRDEDAFVLATKNPEFDMGKFAGEIGILGGQPMGIVCVHNPEWKVQEVRVNTLNTLVLSQYMLDWFRKAGGPFFRFTGYHAVFLPE